MVVAVMAMVTLIATAIITITLMAALATGSVTCPVSPLPVAAPRAAIGVAPQ
jgi:hypothetical protein